MSLSHYHYVLEASRQHTINYGFYFILKQNLK